jgi:hypothetical protein
VAVGLERAHAQLPGQGHCTAVVCFGRGYVGMVRMRGNLAKEVEGPRLVASLTTLAGKRQNPPCDRECVLEPTARSYVDPSHTSESGWNDPNAIVSMAFTTCSSNGMPSATRPESVYA